MTQHFDIVILGLTVTSSWGNGHATTWRSLIRGLSARGHRILFLERDAPWYAANRDEPHPEGAVTAIYSSLQELILNYEAAVSCAALVLVGSYVPEGIQVGEWATAIAGGRCAFYDIDTPITLSGLESGSCAYISSELIYKYDAYLSFTGGPTLQKLERRFGSPMARPLYCSVDPAMYQPAGVEKKWDLGYLGTYSDDRQPLLEELLLSPANHWRDGNFAVAGPQYPDQIVWPFNVQRFEHLSPSEHPLFYGSQRFTLNITRREMRLAGYSPSVRLFEAGACAVPIISDWWEGLDSIFHIGEEVLIAETADDTLRHLHDLSEPRRQSIAHAARARILAEHTPAARAIQIETYLKDMNDKVSSDTSRPNRSGRQIVSGQAAGLPFESVGNATGESSRTVAGVCVD